MPESQQKLRVRELKTKLVTVAFTESDYFALDREADELAIATLVRVIVRRHIKRKGKQ